MKENPPVSKVRAAKLEFYRKKGKVHAKTISGRYNNLRWAMVWLTQIIFYGACWLSWHTPSGDSRQAILFDIGERKLYFFGLVLWPQDALLLAFVLIIAAIALFFATALAGRVFCGFACPQTVYTSIFVWIERKIEGDHLDRLRLDQGPWTARKVALKSAKHLVWAIFALWTGITFVGYFIPIKDLLPLTTGFELGPWASFWLVFYALFTYVQAGLAREAVCQHMCPYSRFQSAMIDFDTKTVTYDQQRGEPRGVRRKDDNVKGDCVDCGICVQVCPTGIDIRDGLQYECINCGLCIDGCDEVMDKVGSPRGLIRFMSENDAAAQAATAQGATQGTKLPKPWWSRPRTLVYVSLLLVCTLLSAFMLATRSTLRVEVLRDRGALLQETAEGRIENSYTVKLINMDESDRQFDIRVSGLPGLSIEGKHHFKVAASSVHNASLTLSVPYDGSLKGVQSIVFEAVASDDATLAVNEATTFILPFN